jgi:hypothetical protein
MSIDFEPGRQRYRVRWREAGRQRSRRFAKRDAAEAFAASLEPSAPSGPRPVPAPSAPSGDGVYVYATAAGTRWRFVFRQSDGSLTTRRGFASRTSAVAARRTAIEQVRRGEVRASRETFAEFWAALLEDKRPYVTAGTLQDYATQGRKRLLPWFGGLRLAAIDEDRVRAWLAEMAELVDAGELSAKTVNNARTCLSMTLGEAARRGQLGHNPCRYVPELPVERAELDYLRLGEIDRYLDACVEHYRPLAEFLIGTGARISEALATRWHAWISTPAWCASRASGHAALTRPCRLRASGSVPCRSGRGWSRRCERSGTRVWRWPRRTAAGSSSALPRSAAATRAAPSRCRRAARPPTTGTSGRSRTPACATWRSTRCATPPRRRGSRPTTR